MGQTTGGDSGVVDHWTNGLPGFGKGEDLVDVLWEFSQDAETRGLAPGPDLISRLLRSRGLAPDFCMTNNAIKFDETVIANEPWSRSFCQLPQTCFGLRMKGGIPAMRVD